MFLKYREIFVCLLVFICAQNLGYSFQNDGTIPSIPQNELDSYIASQDKFFQKMDSVVDKNNLNTWQTDSIAINDFKEPTTISASSEIPKSNEAKLSLESFEDSQKGFDYENYQNLNNSATQISNDLFDMTDTPFVQ